MLIFLSPLLFSSVQSVSQTLCALCLILSSCMSFTCLPSSPPLFVAVGAVNTPVYAPTFTFKATSQVYGLKISTSSFSCHKHWLLLLAGRAVLAMQSAKNDMHSEAFFSFFFFLTREIKAYSTYGNLLGCQLSDTEVILRVSKQTVTGFYLSLGLYID